MWFLVLWALGLISGAIDLFIHGGFQNTSQVCSTLLLHQFVVTFGLVALIGVVENIILAEKSSKSLGWPGGPYQYKYGFSQLGLGIMGVLSIWLRGSFWAGTIVTMYIYGISGLFCHTQLMVQNKKIDAPNVANLIMDVAYQAFITMLSIYAGGIWICS
ncbi:DUF6790 family protein [Anaeromicropila populeti]|uniref:Uncharacterized protein n=1 Tax=Anaeromicropila populeti TaxID=37658 RepID=A0A1I6LG26_9FIRM|nr:DUF6790 family protein [Anaeromicropila populeti]SFS02382.1 hypothetical protein SAMN05661086_03271 [Anaeromicropila populeti]